MRIRLGVLTCAGVALFAACAVPGRDNPNDPQNRPAPALQIVDDTSGSSCSTDFSPGATWPTEGIADRGHCVALDARATTDPSGQAPDTLQYEFSLVATNGTLVSLVGAPGVQLVGAPKWVAVLGSAYRLSLPLRRPLEFAVTVTNRKKGTAVASSSIVLTNDQPIAHADPPRTLPVGGYAWAPGASFTVAFHADGSYDPSGDPLHYCWTFPWISTTPVCSADASDPAFRVAVPSAARHRYVATLVVDDGDPQRVSAPAFASVDVREPSLLLAETPASGGASPYLGATIRVERMDAGVVGFGATPNDIPRGLALVDRPASLGGPVIAAVAEVLDTGDLFSLSSATLADPATPGAASFVLSNGTYPPHVVADPDGSHVHLLVEGYQGNPSFPNIPRVPPVLHTFVVGSGALPDFAEDGNVSPAVVPTALTFNPGLLAADFAGNTWIAAPPTDPIQCPGPCPATAAVVAAGSPVAALVVSDGGSSFTAIAPRPGASDETWLVRTAGAAGVTSKLGSFLRFCGTSACTSGAEIPYEQSAGDRFPSAMTWISPDRFWLEMPGEGLLLVDADALVLGATLDDAVVRIVPDRAFAGRILYDAPLDRAIVQGRDPATNAPSIFRIEADGEIHGDPLPPNTVGPTQEPLRADLVDGNGEYWVTAPQFGGSQNFAGHFARQATVAEDATFGPVVVGANTYPFLDGASGGLWAPQLLADQQGALARISQDGTVLADYHAAIDTAGALVPLPMIGERAALSPDGRNLWFQGPGQAAERLVLQDGALPRLFQVPALAPTILGASAPDRGNELWIAQAGGPSFLIGALSTTGTFTSSLPLPINESLAGWSVDYGGASDACVALFVPPTSQHVLVYRLTDTGGSTLLGQVAGPTDTATVRVDVAGGNLPGGPQVCWVAMTWTEPAATTSKLQIRAWTAANTLLHSADFTLTAKPGDAAPILPSGFFGAGIDLASTGEDRAWIPLYEQPTFTKLRVDWSPGVVSTGATMTPLAGSTFGVGFVTPNHR